MMASMNVWARSRTALSMAALLALAACGGGGGSSSSGGTPSTVAVSGVASKGLLLNAVVTAYAVKADGTKGAALGNTTTDADGRYTLTGLPSGALVLLEVTPKADDSTTMLDEATDLVVPVPAASNFALRAAVNLDGSGTTSAQITPFSEMAVALAASKGGLTPDVVTAANTTVSNFAGVQILTASPAFSQVNGETVAANEAAVKLAAVSELAKTGVDTCAALPPGTPTTEQVLANVSCVTNYLAAQGTSQGVVDALAPALAAAKSDAAATVNTAAIIDIAPVAYVETATQTAIQEAKTLIASVRSTATALSNKSDATSLAARVQAVADASRGVAAPLDHPTMTVLTALSEAITAHQNGAGSSFQLDSGLWWGNGQGGQLVSGCRYFSDADFQNLATGRTAYLGCRVLHTVGYAPTASAGWQPFAVYHRFGLTDIGNDQFTVKSILGRSTISDASGPSPSYGTEQELSAPRTLTVASGDALSVTGALAPGYESRYPYVPEFSSNVEEIVVLGTHQQVAINLSETVGATSTRYNLSGDVSVYQDTAVQSRVSLKSGSYIEEANVDGPTQPKAANLILEAQLETGYKIGGTLVLSNFEQTATHNGPKNAVLNGYLTDMTGSAKLFDGTLTLIMPTDTGLNWDVKLDGTLVTTGANTLTVNLTALQPTLGEVTVTGRYTQGATTFLLTLLSSEATPANDRLSLTTTAGGVGFVAQRSDTVVPIKKGATVLGEFNVDSSRLVYADGTYEQF